MDNTETYQSFHRLVAGRYSCRSYAADRQVPRDVVMAILDAARLAPSACNRQPWRFIVLETPGDREVAIKAYHREWAASAPVFIVACGNHSKAWHRGSDGKDHTDVDVSIAIEHICLAATSLGLGTCWICNFDPEVLCEGLHLPADIEPIAVIALGYPRDLAEVPEKNRLDIQQIVQWGIE